jgi:hypothetical protein
MYLVRWSAVLALGFLAASCRNDVQPDQPRLNGTYVLGSVTGNGPATGSFSFMVSGQVVRKVRYRNADGSLSNEYVAVGTYRGQTSAIDFSLRDDSGRSPYAWTAFGSMEPGPALVLRYPDGADGWVTEHYIPE